jgi:hypothetical protein
MLIFVSFFPKIHFNIIFSFPPRPSLMISRLKFCLHFTHFKFVFCKLHRPWFNCANNIRWKVGLLAKKPLVVTVLQPLVLSRDSAVCIATDYGLENREVGVRVPVWASIFFSPHRPDRWGPPSLLSNGYRGLFPRGWSCWDVKLTTHLQIVPRSRKRGSIHPPPKGLYGVALK